jgi:hypothetical protein
MKRLLLVAFATSVFAVSACASSGGSSKAADEAWAKQVAAAESSMKELNKNNALWRDTGKFLEQAQEAYKAGDKEKADKLMKKVNTEIELAGKQYEAEKNAGPHY